MTDSVARLTVVIPTYNYGALVGETIRSVVGQAIDGVEVLVVDDGSTDDTVAVVEEIGRDAPVRLVRQPNQGPSAARNTGIAGARSAYVMFLDADDLLVPGCLETTLGFLQRHPEVGLFFTNYDMFDHETGAIDCASGVDIWRVFRELPHDVVEPDGWVFRGSIAPAIVRHGGFMSTSGLTFRRDLVDRVGPLRVGYSYGEDDEFYARLAYETTTGYVDRILSRRRNHGRSLVNSPAHSLRNARHMLELSEIQREYYRSDAQMQAILRPKIESLAVTCVWTLLEHGDARQALPLARRYLARYPSSSVLWKLTVRALLARSRFPNRAS